MRKDKDKKNKEEWLAFEWPGVHLHQGYPSAKAWWYDFPLFGAPLSKMAVTYSRGTMSYYVIREEFEGNGAKFFEKVRVKPEIMFAVLKKVDEAAEVIFSLGKKYQSVDFSRLPDRELLKCQKELFHWDEILWRKGQIQNLLELHNNYLSAYVRKLISETFGKKYEAKYFQILSAGEYKSMAEKQDDDFAKLVEAVRKLKSKPKEIVKAIKRHADKYSWMLYGWMGPALDFEYFQNNVEAALKDKKFRNEMRAREAERELFKHEREEIAEKFSEPDRKLVRLLRKLLEAKAKRVDAHSLTYFIGDKIYSEIGRRKFLSISQLRSVPPEEISVILRKPDPHRLNVERDYVMYWFENGKVKKMVGAEGRKKFEHIAARLPRVKMTNLIKGEMAYMGKAKGKARVILEAADFSQFRKGEILVTRMTDPSYVPLMKISRAIVTDIGGITCHAAIVSRELKKPCVIGAKIATKVLRTGDALEIDANEGIIKKIK